MSQVMGAGPAFPQFNPRGCPALVASPAGRGRPALHRRSGDFDLRELRTPSQVPRPVRAKNAGTAGETPALPCPCKERRDKDGAAAGFEILFGKDGPAPLLQ